MSMHTVRTKLGFKPYAVVVEYDDLDYNQNEQTFILIETKEDYENYLKSSEELQPYTGLNWKVIFKREE